MFDSFPYIHVVADAQLGVLAIGGTHGLIMAGSLRAWDMRAKKPRWDVKELDGIKLGRSDKNQIEVVGHNVYVAHEKVLFCLDLATGQKKWSHTFPGSVDCSTKLALSDPHPPGTHGAILVASVLQPDTPTAGGGSGLHALDRESGALLWENTSLEAVSLASAENRGRTFVWSGFDQVQIYRPESSTPLFTLEQALEPGTVQNGVLLSVVDTDSVVGDAPEQGIYGLDAAAGRQAFFVPTNDLEPFCVPCATERHVFAIRRDRAGIYAGPDGEGSGSPVARTAIGALLPGNHTLGVFVYGIEGETSRRFVGLDPETLAIRFDSGPLGALKDYETDPKDHKDYLATDGASFVFVDGKKLWEDVELRSVEAATGRPLWTHRFEKYFTHEFRDGVLIVRGKEMLEVKRPSNGEVIATLRLND